MAIKRYIPLAIALGSLLSPFSVFAAITITPSTLILDNGTPQGLIEGNNPANYLCAFVPGASPEGQGCYPPGSNTGLNFIGDFVDIMDPNVIAQPGYYVVETTAEDPCQDQSIATCLADPNTTQYVSFDIIQSAPGGNTSNPFFIRTSDVSSTSFLANLGGGSSAIFEALGAGGFAEILAGIAIGGLLVTAILRVFLKSARKVTRK